MQADVALQRNAGKNPLRWIVCSKMSQAVPGRMLRLLVAGLALATICGAQEAGGGSGNAPGWIATYRDDTRTLSEVVTLPELGLHAGETPHPAIKPAFSVTFEGFLVVPQAGTYTFHTKGNLTLGGKSLTGPEALQAGSHPVHLTYTHESGALRLGVFWESEHFVKEPLPPAALTHGPLPPQPADPGGSHPAPPHRIRATLAAMKCASCHDDGFLATMHHRFAPESLLTLMRHANQPKWHGAPTGPALEENDKLRQLVEDLKKLPRGERSRDQVAGPAEGRRMVGMHSGLACVACHDIKDHKTQAESKGPNLALMTERVSYDWFVRWMENPQRLKPGVPMPAYFAGQSAEERSKNIDALWDYLAQGRQMELPEGLQGQPNGFLLMPSSQPVHTRTYIRLPNGRELLRAICVGLPNGVSYCFDAETRQLVYVWVGGFLDMAPHWQNQSGMPTPPIGRTFHLAADGEGLRIDGENPVFRGYEIVDGIPRFEFDSRGDLLTLRIDAPAADHLTLCYSITSTRKRDLTYTASPSLATTSTLGTWNAHQLSIAAEGKTEFTITLRKK